MLSALARKVLRTAAATQTERMLRGDPLMPVRPMVEPLESRVLLSRVAGIDASQWQGTIDWNQVRGAGKEFAFVRATIGGSTDSDNLDTKFLTNMPAAATAGVLVGAYHHAKPDATANDAVNEANWFLSNAGQYMSGGWLRPVLVIEQHSGLDVIGLSQWVNTFSDTIENAKGIDPVIYTNSNYARNHLNTSVAVHDLWLARPISGSTDPQTGDPETPAGYPNPYGAWNEPTPTSPPSHYVWDFWQHSFTGSVAGISGDVDLDVYHGDRASLESRFLIQAGGEFRGVAVSFGPYETPIPSGYINFGDQLFGNIFGYQMGWSDAGTQLNTQSTGPDQRYKTYALPNANSVSRSFDIAVPEGSYRVRVVAGGQAGNTQKFWAEGVAVVDGVTHTGTEFLSGVTTVNVTDGKLTINSNYGTAPNSRLVFLDVVPGSRTGAVPAAPSAVSAMPASSTSVDVRWIDNADNEGRDPSTFSNSTWAQVNEGYKIERSEFVNSAWSGWSTPVYVRGNAELYHDTELTPQKEYKYRVTAINAAGASEAVQSAGVTTLASSGKQANTPTGAPWQVPSRIQAEDFDRGGEGTSYHDISTGSAGGFYRQSDMDVGRIGTPATGAPALPREHRVGWFRAGEWLEYTIDVPVARSYVMDFNISAPGSGGKFHAASIQGGIETNLAASAVGGTWDVPNTGSWNSLQQVAKTVDLPAGVQVIRIYGDQNHTSAPGVMDFDWFDLTPAVTISGASEVPQGLLYTLGLEANSKLDVTSWAIDWGDGETSTISGDRSTATHRYLSAGNFAISAIATQWNGPSSVSPPLNLLVTASVVSVAGADQITEGGTYALNLSVAPDTNVALWRVDWGDGSDPDHDGAVGEKITISTGSDPNIVATHVFGNGSSFTVAATAFDAQNNELGQARKFVQGINAPPTIDASNANFTVETNARFALDLVTFTDGGSLGGTPETYTATIDWGDGTTSQGKVRWDHRAGEPLPLYYLIGNHRYSVSNTYTVFVTVLDSDGGTSSASATIGAEQAMPYVVPGLAGTMSALTFTNHPTEARFRNALAFFVTDDLGRAGTLLPSDPGYAEAAATDPTMQVVFPKGTAPGATRVILLPAGTKLEFFMVRDANIADFLQQNPTNSIQRWDEPRLFFLHSAANPDDDYMHYRQYVSADGSLKHGFEDLDFGGDQDFDDLVFTIATAPTLAAAPSADNTSIVLTWSDPHVDEDGYVIERSVAGAPFAPLGPAVGANVVTFTDADVVVGTVYTYRVRAFKGTTNYLYSNEASASLDAPGNLPPSIFADPPLTFNPAIPSHLPDQLDLVATIRDQHPSTSQRPTDFQWHLDNRGGPGMVQATLGPDRTPRLIEPWPSGYGAIHGPDSFNEWFHPVAGKNVTLQYPMTFGKNAAGLYEFVAPEFYPINDRGFGAELAGRSENGNFTMELHTSFTYRATEPPMNFKFVGDDDVWVFINDKLVIDIGGIHPAAFGEVTLDAAKATELGLVDGRTYIFDFFYAERWLGGSSFHATTSIPLGVDPIYRTRLTATDPDTADTLTWQVIEPAGAVIKPPSGVSPLESLLEWAPAGSTLAGAPQHFKVAVSDGNGHTVYREWDVDITGVWPNVAPELTGAITVPDAVSIGRHAEWNVSQSWFDANSDKLTFEPIPAQPLPAGMKLSEHGLFTWTPTASQAGTTAIHYRVIDRRGGETPASFSLDVTNLPPEAPTGLTGEDVGTIVLNWNRNFENDVTGYRVFRAMRRPDGVIVDEAEIGAPPQPLSGGVSFVDPGGDLIPGRRYVYWVKALSSNGLLSQPSGTVNVTRPDFERPHAPTTLTAAVITGGIQLAWQNDDREVDVLTYEIFAGATETFEADAAHRIAQVLGHLEPAFTDNSAEALLRDGSRRYYKIVAVDESGNISEARQAFVDLPLDRADLDVFEDVNQDGTHDDSAGAEQSEASTPTELPLVSDADPKKLALVLREVTAGETVTFNYDPTELTLYRDAAGTDPIPASTPQNISAFGLSGSGTAILYGAAAIEGMVTGPVSVLLGSAAEPFMAMLGGVEGKKKEEEANANFNWGAVDAANTLVIGFSGHTQAETESAAKVSDNGFWEPKPGSAVVTLAKKIAAADIDGVNAGNILMLAEDPENNAPALGALRLIPDRFCGAGVAGWDYDGDGNIVTFENGEFVRDQDDGQNNRFDVLGAIHAVQKAVEFHGVTKLALFGFSHGGSSVRLLTELIKQRKQQWTNGSALQIRFTAYLDAVRLPAKNEEIVLFGEENRTLPLGFHRGRRGQGVDDFIEHDEPEFRFPHLTGYHVNVYQMQPAAEDDEKLYTVPGEGPDDDAELLDLRGGWLDPDRYLANANDTGSDYQDKNAGTPPKFYQANIEVQGYVNDPDKSKAQHSNLEVVAQGQNNVTDTPATEMPWTPNADHGDVPASGNVHKFVIHHMTNAFSA